MPQFQWEGRTSSGETRKGVSKAASGDALRAALRKEGVILTSMQETKEAGKQKYNPQKKIKDNETLPRLVAATEIGTKAKIILVRDNKQMEVSVTIGELQEEGLRASKKTEIEKDLGLVVQDITAEIAKHLNLKDRKGVIVTDVIPGSPAQEADIRSGDVIREIGRKPVRSVAEFKEAVKRSNVKEGIVMLIQRENATFYAVIRE